MNFSIHSFRWLVFLFSVPLHALGQTTELNREIERILRHESPVDFNIVPGILVGMIDADSTFIMSFGRSLDKDGIYELGSVTKPLVAWLASQALDSLGWNHDTPACKFLPDSLCTEAWRRITVDHLLVHRAGLPRVPPGLGSIEQNHQDPYGEYDLNFLANHIHLIEPIPGMYGYSHVGYSMLYWLFERVGGLESFARKKFKQEWNGNKTQWNIHQEHIEPGYGFDGRPRAPWTTSAFEPALGLKSCMNDLIAFLRHVNPILQRNTPTMTPSLKKELKKSERSGVYKVVEGWFLIRSGRHLLYYHNGRTGGHHVSIAFIPELRKGVIVISNGAAGSNELSLQILHMLRRAK